MTDQFQKLALILEQLRQTVTELIRLSKAECQSLQKNEVAALKEALPAEEKAASRMEQLERERQQIERCIGTELRIARVPFSRILQEAGPLAAGLQRSGRELAEALAELQNLTATKQLLIRQSLSFETELFQALAGVQEGYNRRGEKLVGEPATTGAINRSV